MERLLPERTCRCGHVLTPEASASASPPRPETTRCSSGSRRSPWHRAPVVRDRKPAAAVRRRRQLNARVLTPTPCRWGYRRTGAKREIHCRGRQPRALGAGCRSDPHRDVVTPLAGPAESGSVERTLRLRVRRARTAGQATHSALGAESSLSRPTRQADRALEARRYRDSVSVRDLAPPRARGLRRPRCRNHVSRLRRRCGRRTKHEDVRCPPPAILSRRQPT